MRQGIRRFAQVRGVCPDRPLSPSQAGLQEDGEASNIDRLSYLFSRPEETSMRFVLPILLAAAVAMAGVPHALCACGCSWIGRGKSDAAAGNSRMSCPHCWRHQTRDDGDDAPPAGPEPCRCGSCDDRLAVADRCAANGTLSSPETCQRLDDASLSLPFIAPEAISPRADAPVLCTSALPVRALPILLGHLLL